MLLTFASLALLGALSASAATAAADETTPTGQAGGAAHWVVWAGPEPHSSMQGLQSIRVVFDNFTDENDGKLLRLGLAQP